MIAAQPLVTAAEPKHSHLTLSKEDRAAFFRTAQVWTPTRVSAMDIRVGPGGAHAFPLDARVDCEFTPSKPSGSSKKFDCALPNGDVVKVRYGDDNAEVEGSVLASRLLWALGFGADAAYPVHVVCHGCSDDPWNKRGRTQKTYEFDVATIERKPQGHEIHSEPDGWSWSELDLVDDTQGGAPRAQRDALKLLAVFMQHTDNKAVQQKLLCQPGGLLDDGTCSKPFLYLHDVGLTFGRANYLNRTSTGSVNFEQWSGTPIWRDKAKCEGHLSKSSSGTLGDPKVGERGRAFLAGLLDQLTDRQLHDLFQVGHVERRSRKPGSSEPAASIDEWVAAFKQKRAEIDATRCPTS
ncbi:MAG TPA: hypothetical protein VLV86_24215 [Vicinamibacterales bacterium]|nr:hypothetical protein [Vicinamibacterales bacterium]